MKPAEEFRAAAIERGIKWVPNQNCALCGVEVGWLVEDPGPWAGSTTSIMHHAGSGGDSNGS